MTILLGIKAVRRNAAAVTASAILLIAILHVAVPWLLVQMRQTAALVTLFRIAIGITPPVHASNIFIPVHNITAIELLAEMQAVLGGVIKKTIPLAPITWSKGLVLKTLTAIGVKRLIQPVSLHARLRLKIL